MDSTGTVRQSFLAWALASLGPTYAILLPLVAFGGCATIALLIWKGRGPWVTACVLLAANCPLLIGVFAALQGAMRSYLLVATAGSSPRPAELAAGISTALVAPCFAILLMVPSYGLAIVGGLIRSLATVPTSSHRP